MGFIQYLEAGDHLEAFRRPPTMATMKLESTILWKPTSAPEVWSLPVKPVDDFSTRVSLALLCSEGKNQDNARNPMKACFATKREPVSDIQTESVTPDFYPEPVPADKKWTAVSDRPWTPAPDRGGTSAFLFQHLKNQDKKNTRLIVSLQR